MAGDCFRAFRYKSLAYMARGSLPRTNPKLGDDGTPRPNVADWLVVVPAMAGIVVGGGDDDAMLVVLDDVVPVPTLPPRRFVSRRECHRGGVFRDDDEPLEFRADVLPPV